MIKKQEKQNWNPERAIGYSGNDKVAVIYSVKVSSIRIVEKRRNRASNK